MTKRPKVEDARYQNLFQAITPLRAIAIYVIVSVGFAAIARPGYNSLSTFATFIGGPTTGLKLGIDSRNDIYYQTLKGARKFNREAMGVSVIAFGLWFVGGLLTFLSATFKWKYEFLLALMIAWVIGSMFNSIFFGLRSL